MQWDLGLQGIAVLAAMSVALGAFTQLVFWNRASTWLGVGTAILAFIGGVLVSEVWFGWATAEELQPNIDGLSFDEVLISFLVAGVIILIARYLTRTKGRGPITLAR